MTNLKGKISKEIIQALKEGCKEEVGALRFLLAQVKNEPLSPACAT